MTEPLVEQYLKLILTAGAQFDDPKLFALFGQLTPQEVQRVHETLIAAYIRTLPPPPPNAPTSPNATDFVGLYLEIVRRGAGADDPRLAAMMAAMMPDELERGRKALGELWLEQPIAGPPN